MKILFFCSGYESIGVEYLSASLKDKGHETYLIYTHNFFNSFTVKNVLLHKILNEDKYTEKRIKQINPDIICFSTVTENYQHALKWANKIKNFSSAPIIFGGIHTTSIPDKVISHEFIDYICIGEGEEALIELTSALEKNQPTDNIKNIWSKKEGTVIKTEKRTTLLNLDSLPFPDKDLFYKENPYFKDVYGIMAKRGCLYRCSYCHNSLHKNKDKIRQRSPENVIAELKKAKEKYKIKKVCFFDDMLLSDIHWLKNFTTLYKEKINLPFVCAAHPTEITNESIEMLIKAECSAIGMGIQSANEKTRKTILNRFESNNAIIKALSLLDKSPILVYVDILIGLPLQTDLELIETATFLNKHKPDMVLPIWLKYYPDIQITKKAFDLKILSDSDIENIEKGISPNNFSGLSFSKEKAKIIYLLLLSPILPNSIFNFILKNNIYKLFPSFSSFIFIRIFLSLASAKSRIFKKKNKYIFSLKTSIMYLIFLMKRKLTLYREIK